MTVPTVLHTAILVREAKVVESATGAVQVPKGS